VLFAGIGKLVTFWFVQTSAGQRLHVALHQFAYPSSAAFVGTAIASLILGWGSGHLINFGLWIIGTDRAKLLIVGRYDDGLFRMLHLAMYSGAPVSVTLSNRKVYIGYVFEPPGDSPHDHSLTLMLLLSGYRDDVSMKFVESINYADRTVLAETRAASQIFTTTISLNDIVSASMFDQAVYEHEFAERLII
jgi:hypothetical protein